MRDEEIRKLAVEAAVELRPEREAAKNGHPEALRAKGAAYLVRKGADAGAVHVLREATKVLEQHGLLSGDDNGPYFTSLYMDWQALLAEAGVKEEK